MFGLTFVKLPQVLSGGVDSEREMMTMMVCSVGSILNFVTD